MLDQMRGRTAVEASAAWNLFKTFVQLVIFWTTFLAVLPLAVAWCESRLELTGWRFDSPSLRLAAVGVFLAASCLGIASAITMAIVGRGTPLPADCPRAIVVAGPYRFIRNPMAAAGITQGVAVGVYLGSPAVMLYAITGAFVWNYLVRPWEERDLEERFGDSFRDYRQAVRCWAPRVTPFTPGRPSATAVGLVDAHAARPERE